MSQLDGTLTSDSLTADMKRLFQIAFNENPNKDMSKNEVYQLVRCPDGDLFGWLDLGERSGQSIFGKKLREFTGRSLGGIYLQIDNRDNRRPRYRFTQEQPPTQENMAAAVLGLPATQSNQEGTCHDYTPGPPTSINDIFREEKARNELSALEREQKEALYNEVMEKRAREFGDEWPRIQEMSHDPRFDHIPKRWPGYEDMMAKAFPGPRTAKAKEPHEPPAAS